MGSLHMTANHFGVANCTASKLFSRFPVQQKTIGRSPHSSWPGGNENKDCWF